MEGAPCCVSTARVLLTTMSYAQAHDAAISKISWAHPEFGTILATASFDRTVKVWEQTSSTDADGAQVNGAGVGSSSGTRWTERAMLVDARGTVRGVEFAPSHFGLKLVRLLLLSYRSPSLNEPYGRGRRRSRRTTICASTSAWSSHRSPHGSYWKRSTSSASRPLHLQKRPRIQWRWLPPRSHRHS